MSQAGYLEDNLQCYPPQCSEMIPESPLQTLFCLRLSHQMHLTRLLLQVPVVLLTHSTKKLDEPDACIFLLWYQIHQSNISALSDWNSYQIQQFLWNPVLPTVQTSHSIFPLEALRLLPDAAHGSKAVHQMAIGNFYWLTEERLATFPVILSLPASLPHTVL
ncbi:hypothetical protein [Dorea longicatena]|uniref:hypothetical protein n=1 Tax=Dorea longicatena TaxID=88431 RepID=UPI0012BCBFA1